MNSAEIRQAFLDYFEKQGHTVVASSSLVPGNDPTLLFTNAGMVQFKDVFLGLEQRPYTRAVSSQRCVRAGGKHNDLENVGYTARHHTFFEMLGNFSFGDYFKREAIGFAWEFLTGVLKLPAERLWVTVHVSDDEAADIWIKEIGIDPSRFSRLDEDNFWQMGDTGPCGPSSEIFYDHGEDVPGGPPGSENDDLDRYIEIWNLVFMQYEKSADGSMKPLPKPSVDTGMGLERIAAVMQHVHTNYEIDLFSNLLAAVSKVTGNADESNMSRRVIADHIRSCAFLVVDGVQPSNEGRGYVLRRIIRRAIRHGHKLGVKGAFFHKLVAALVTEMGAAYPELSRQQQQVERVLLAEEEQFARTLDNGMAVLEEHLQDLPSDVIPGEVIFQLYDTYGFPTDLTNDIARERNLVLDMAGYEDCMQAQKARARAAGKFAVDYSDKIEIAGSTEFCGYQTLQGEGQVLAMLVDGQEVDALEAANSEAAIVVDKTPFYAESGGQVGDRGLLSNSHCELEVLDTRKSGAHFLHRVRLLKGKVTKGEQLDARVDPALRKATALNHSATHLLHAALRQVLGEHVQQKGSLVDAEKLRFDFSHFEAVKPDTLKTIERKVNEEILRNTPVETVETDMESARNMGAMALFGEKYGDTVRVLSMGEGFSVELCGGTHVARTGDIGLLRIVSEAGVASGVRRIEAVTGLNALALFDQQEETLNAVADTLKTGRAGLVDKVTQLQQSARQLEKDVQQLRGKLANASGSDISSQAVEVAGVKVLATSLPDVDLDTLRNTMDQLKNKLGEAVILLATSEGEKVTLVAGVTKALSSRVKAGDLMREVAPMVGGKGGGRPDMAQGGGNNPAAIPEALAFVPQWLEKQLG